MAQDLAPSFKPPWAVVTWCDDRFIYVEIPTKDGPPYIFKEDLTEGGLSRVLHLMRDARRKAPPQITGDYNAAVQAAVKVIRKTAKDSSATEEQRAHARDVLRKLGLTTRR